jgi:hypothetical protein
VKVITKNMQTLATEGVHKACIIAVDEKEVQSTYGRMRGKMVRKVVITFQMLDQHDELGNPVLVKMFWNWNFGNTTNLGKLMAGMNYNIPAGIDFDLDDLVSEKLTVKIQHRQASDDMTFANVVGYVKTDKPRDWRIPERPERPERPEPKPQIQTDSPTYVQCSGDDCQNNARLGVCDGDGEFCGLCLQGGRL